LLENKKTPAPVINNRDERLYFHITRGTTHIPNTCRRIHSVYCTYVLYTYTSIRFIRLTPVNAARLLSILRNYNCKCLSSPVLGEVLPSIINQNPSSQLIQSVTAVIPPYCISNSQGFLS